MIKNSEDYIKLATMVYNKHFSGFKRFKEDLIQEGICSLLQNEDKYDSSRGQWSSFAYKVIHNAMAFFLRSEKKQDFHLLEDDLDSFENLSDGSFEEDLLKALDAKTDLCLKKKIILNRCELSLCVKPQFI